MSKAVSQLKAPPPGAGLPTKVQILPPNQTLYVRGLPSSKIQKDDLRTGLYMLFSTYGSVLDVVVLKTMRMRGQAHIVYRDVTMAMQAMRALQGFSFLGSELKIAYAKTKSNVIAHLDGTFMIPIKNADKVEVSDLQQSIFNAPPPGSATAPLASIKSAPTNGKTAVDVAVTDTKAADTRGQKRTRDEEEEEEEEEDSDVEMEEDSDDE